MVAHGAGHSGDGGDQYQPQYYQHHHYQHQPHHHHGQPPRERPHEVIADDGGKSYQSSDDPIHKHTGPSAPRHTNSHDDEMHLQQHAYAGSGCPRPDLQYQGGELSRLASHIGKMLEPKPIVVYYKKKRPGDQQQRQPQEGGEDEVPAMPLGHEGEMAHAVPRGQRRVRNPPPRMTHLGPSSQGGSHRQGISGHNQERESDQIHAEGFGCYYSRRPGEYLPDNRSDWRPVELRDDEATPLPWERRKHHSSSAGTDTPLHANTSVKINSRVGQRDGDGDGPSKSSGDNDDLPPMVLQTMFQYDDEEFIAAANTIMERIQWREVVHMDRKIGKMMASTKGAPDGCGDDGEGSTSNSTLSSSDSAPSLIDDLGKGFVEAFLSALEYRLEGTNHGEGDNEMDGIVVEIQSMVEQHAAYFVAKEDIKVQMEAMPNGDEGDNDNGGDEIPQDPPKKRPEFLPHADQSIAGYVPLEHNTPRSKNTSTRANKGDEISIAKSFASTVKSAYEKIGETLKSISREGSEADLQDKDRADEEVALGGTEQETKSTSTVAYGRFIEPSGSTLVDQSQRRQELVSEMQRLHAFMEKAGPMHNEVQRSCQYRIEELRTELEAMTLAAVNDGEISEVSSRSFDDKEEAVLSQSTTRRQEEKAKDQARDELIEKIEKLEQQLASASNRVVRVSCERRIEQLQRDLTELDGLDSPPKSLDSTTNAEVEPVVQIEPSASRDARQDSLQRQAVVDEMKRVEHVLNSTRIEDVKHSCRVRLEALRKELSNLTPGEVEEVTIAPSASFSVQEDRNLITHGGPTQAHPKTPTSHPADKGKRRRLVKVMAPTDLPGGCKFSARLGNGDEFLATVPAGGVRKGEIFVSPVGIIEELELGASGCGCIMPWMDYLYDKL